MCIIVTGTSEYYVAEKKDDDNDDDGDAVPNTEEKVLI